jgi:hypothetical protein
VVISRALLGICQDFVGTNDLPEFQRSIRIARSDVVSVGSELPSNNYGKSPLIISCNKSVARERRPFPARSGIRNTDLCFNCFRALKKR